MGQVSTTVVTTADVECLCAVTCRPSAHWAVGSLVPTSCLVLVFSA